MLIALLGKPWPAAQKDAFEAVGLEVVPPERAALRLVAAPEPPAKPPKSPWLWCPPREASLHDTMAAVMAGAYDVVPQGDECAATVKRRSAELAVRTTAGDPPEGYIARSASAQRMLAELERVAPTSMAVLLTGETGTGKDVAARHLHARSGRTGKLVPINCAAIPNDLIEGELFGYVRGAFSGAVADYEGLLRAASGGTVFLDEVDDTPKTLQIKLLRVLEDHVVGRLGESGQREVDFRVIAATNRDLGELVRRDEFGADLYQRLAIVRIELPPLRERRDDIPELATHLIARFYREEPAAPHRVSRLSSAALAALQHYPWPGNVRELRNVMFQALVQKRAGDDLLLSDLPEHIVRGTPRDAEPATPDGRPEAQAGQATTAIDRAALARMIDEGRMNLRAVRDELERCALELALARAGGSPARAARLLGEVGRGSSRDPGGTVRAMLRRHGLV
ncbi:MAG TPA: sigma 54-interacting transcriptional regulator [Kofleriaceae bacterium]|jgi:DNA-binding NtrC family response regulator|nr:sigma 54-interacting transcriptional regulator [Kofleriaceae bacterium]